jgi:hypothetical protein
MVLDGHGHGGRFGDAAGAGRLQEKILSRLLGGFLSQAAPGHALPAPGPKAISGSFPRPIPADYSHLRLKNHPSIHPAEHYCQIAPKKTFCLP